MPNEFYGSFGSAAPTDAFLEEISESIFGLIAFFGAFYVFFALFFLALAIVNIVAQWKLYQKAGEAGWKCLIPFYSEWVHIRIALGRTSVGWFILALVPGLNIIERYYIGFYFGKRYSGKDSIALLYLLLPLVTAILMAYSNRYQYIANRDPVDSGRGGIDGDWPLWANEESPYRADDLFSRPVDPEERVEEQVRYDSRYASREEQARKPYYSSTDVPNDNEDSGASKERTKEE